MKIFQCPENAKYKIKDKNECIDDCTKDRLYKYLYNGFCLKECPSNTQLINNICRVKSEKCTFGEDNDLQLYNNDLSVIEILAKTYISEFTYTNKHISSYKNENYSIIIYKDASCINELALKVPNINFESCYNKVKEAYNINQDLIVSVAEKKILANPITFFSFFHPVSGEKLDVTKICLKDKIMVQENLLEFLDENYDYYKTQNSLTSQGINIFDKNHPFFNDLCYDYENILKKDIPLSRRIKDIYPNASLCDPGCIYESINLEDMTTKCDCKFNDITNNNLIKDNELISGMAEEIFDVINSSNILVLKCIKYMFKHFSRSIGGWISLIAIIAFIVMVVFYFLFGLKNIQLFIMKLIEKYIEYISKGGIADKKIDDDNNNNEGNNEYNNEKNAPPKKGHSIKNKKTDIHLITLKDEKLEEKSRNTKLESNKESSKNFSSIEAITIYQKNIRELTDIDEPNSDYFKDFFKDSLDDMEFDDALVYDHRTFGEMMKECLREKQIIAITFIAEDELKPRYLKVMVFILNIILYLVINGLFFSEEVIEELYDLDENKEHFFSFFTRLLQRLIYCFLVGVVIGFIEEFFFVEMRKIKGICLREKDNIKILNEKILELINEIKKRNFAFIIIESIILLFSFIYLCCFNYVYPYTQIEWIKSSIAIIIIIQIISVLKCLLISSLRVLSFKIKSERLYKISKLFG